MNNVIIVEYNYNYSFDPLSFLKCWKHWKPCAKPLKIRRSGD